MAILHILGLKRWKRGWKQTRKFVVTAATEVLDPGVGSVGIKTRASLDPRDSLSETAGFLASKSCR